MGKNTKHFSDSEPFSLKYRERGVTLILSFGIYPFDMRGEEDALRHLSALPAVVFGDEAYLHRSDLRRTHFFWGVYPGAFEQAGVVERSDAL